jgi:hypothetical protein
MPRGPVVRPASPAEETSLVLDLAALPNVFAIDERAFDALEAPGYFMDPLHMNAKGCLLFSHMLAKEIVWLLGPGAATAPGPG